MQAPSLPPGTTQRTLAIIWRRGGNTALPVDKRSSKTSRSPWWQISPRRYPDQQLPQFGLRSIYVLTQFNSMSLHRHIQASYKFDNFSAVSSIFSPHNRHPRVRNGIRARPDAVRQNMRYFLERPFEFYLILSGDQLYRMDFARSCISTSLRGRDHSRHKTGPARSSLGFRDHAERRGQAYPAIR